MNNFGQILPIGTKGIYKASLFYKGYLPGQPKVPESGRTFIIESGPGRECTPGSRKVFGHWEDDNVKDTVDVHSFEAVIIGGKRIKQLVTGDPPPETPESEPVAINDHEPPKAVRRKR